MNVLIKGSLSLVATMFLIGGCASGGKGVGPIETLSVNASLEGVGSQSNSLMQRMMAEAARKSKEAVFTPGSSDRVIESTYMEDPFDSIIRFSSEEKRVVVKGEFGAAKMQQYYIYPKRIAAMAVEDAVYPNAKNIVDNNGSIGITQVFISPEIKPFAVAIAAKYDIANNEKTTTVSSFLKYLSSAGVANGVRIFYEFDKSNNLLKLTDRPAPFKLSPYRLGAVKKQLDELKIPYRVDDGQLYSEGSFEQWMSIYKLCDGADPYSGQTYSVHGPSGNFYVQEGYYPDRLMSIEFIGWNHDGTRSYLLHKDGFLKKVTTQNRIVPVEFGNTIYSITFF